MRRHYLEYKQLKKKLKKVVEAAKEESYGEQENFKRALDSEVRSARGSRG